MANFYKQIIKMLTISSLLASRQNSMFANRLASSGGRMTPAALFAT